MARKFWRVTAEAVVAAVDCAYVHSDEVSANKVAAFTQLTEDQATAALGLAADLGFLTENGGQFTVDSPLCRLMETPGEAQKATVLRVLLEVYEPFALFRRRLEATGSVQTAAIETKATLDLDTHPTDVVDTLVSLGQFAQVLVAEGGGAYKVTADPSPNPLSLVADASSDLASAEARVLIEIGEDAAALVSRNEVIIPLADALKRAGQGDGRGAVVSAGNATESFLTGYGARVGHDVSAQHGVNAKAQALADAGHLPKKLLNASKYLGHARNAADHGVDSEIGAAWDITTASGLNFTFVACAWVYAVVSQETGKGFVI